jgi:hypothetical protein
VRSWRSHNTVSPSISAVMNVLVATPPGSPGSGNQPAERPAASWSPRFPLPLTPAPCGTSLRWIGGRRAARIRASKRRCATWGDIGRFDLCRVRRLRRRDGAGVHRRNNLAFGFQQRLGLVDGRQVELHGPGGGQDALEDGLTHACAHGPAAAGAQDLPPACRKGLLQRVTICTALAHLPQSAA